MAAAYALEFSRARAPDIVDPSRASLDRGQSEGGWCANQVYCRFA
jgi:hypothetical protein